MCLSEGEISGEWMGGGVDRYHLGFDSRNVQFSKGYDIPITSHTISLNPVHTQPIVFVDHVVMKGD